MNVISNHFWNDNFYGIEQRGMIGIDSLKFAKRNFRELFKNRDTINYINFRLPQNITYGDFVGFINVIQQEKLEFALNNDNLIIWYENPNNPSFFNKKIFICGTFFHNHPDYQSSPEIDYKIFFSDWHYLIIISGWILLAILNALKLKQIFTHSS